MMSELRARLRDRSARALRLDASSIAQGGLAFLIAYAIAYLTQTI